VWRQVLRAFLRAFIVWLGNEITCGALLADPELVEQDGAAVVLVVADAC
jgi:hypothetical protein